MKFFNSMGNEIYSTQDTDELKQFEATLNLKLASPDLFCDNFKTEIVISNEQMENFSKTLTRINRTKRIPVLLI